MKKNFNTNDEDEPFESNVINAPVDKPGLSRHTFTVKIAGSNPVGSTETRKTKFMRLEFRKNCD